MRLGAKQGRRYGKSAQSGWQIIIICLSGSQANPEKAGSQLFPFRFSKGGACLGDLQNQANGFIGFVYNWT